MLRALAVKEITVESEETLEALKQGAFHPNSFLFSVLDKVTFRSGKTQFPYTDVASAGQTSFVIKGLEVVKTIEVAEVALTDETWEDISPTIGVKPALLALLAQAMGKQVELDFITALRNDSNVTAPVVGNVTKWKDILDVVKDFEPALFTTAGGIRVVISPESFLTLLDDTAFLMAGTTLKQLGISISVSEHLGDKDIIAFHGHGVAGGFEPRTPQTQRNGRQNRTDLVGSYSYGYAWDPRHVRFAK